MQSNRSVRSISVFQWHSQNSIQFKTKVVLQICGECRRLDREQVACIFHLLHPPSTLVQGTAVASPPPWRTERQTQALPQPQGQKLLPFCRGMDAHRDPTPHISYVPELSRPKAKQQENSKPRGPGEAETCKPVLLRQK